MTEKTEKLLTPEEVSEIVSLHPETIRVMARDGRLPAVKIGRFWRFRPAAVREWIDAGAADPTAKK